jgi:hypothetical protein
MNRKTFFTLAALALAGLALAWWAAQRRGEAPGLYSGKLMLPGLSEQINQVSALVLQNSTGQQVHIRLDEGRWVVAEKDRYPADVGKVRSALLILADAKVVEEKTSRPDMYSRLGVEPVDAPGANNLKLTIVAPEGQRELIIGKPAMNKGNYVRRAEDEASLLVNQVLALKADPMAWVAPELLNLVAESVRQVTIFHPDGQELAISASQENPAEFSILGIPDGRQPVSEFAANGIASALDQLTFQDVRRSPESLGAGQIRSQFTTRSGLIVEVLLLPGDPTWARFSVSIAEQAEKSAIDQASQMNQRLAGWDYAIPAQRADQLSKHLGDLLTSRDE